MKSPYRSPWTRNPYANPIAEAEKAEAVKLRRKHIVNIAVWSGVPGVIMMTAVAVVLLS